MKMDALTATLALAAIAAAPTGKAHRPLPVEAIGQWFGADAYPPDAVTANEQGRVGAQLTVDATGKPTGCVVSSSSGSFALDSGTCGIAMAHLTFKPATDVGGQPIAGVYPFAVRWVIPTPAAAPAQPAMPPQ
ncbi:TonB family protein [Sphingomonas bacterium]|uniref:TonB family protein n=1 Tax=Sphingomonas bacterium TaxID=1895847 RepID=UPI001577367E|nr:TonB family protein [Sphingomonas bacterium]